MRLRSDIVGNVLGSFFIPNPNDITTPKFECGKKVFRLTSSNTNSQNALNVGTDASQTFDSTGTIKTMQSTIITVRNINTHTQIQTETRSSTSGGGGTYSTSSTSKIGSDSESYSPVKMPVHIGQEGGVGDDGVFDSAFVGTVIRDSGSGTGSDGGFDVGGQYLAFQGTGAPNNNARFACLNPIDSSQIDTLTITAIVLSLIHI